MCIPWIHDSLDHVYREALSAEAAARRVRDPGVARRLDADAAVVSAAGHRAIPGDERKTVRNHVERTYTKSGASNRVGASLYALERGLAGPTRRVVRTPTVPSAGKPFAGRPVRLMC